ncbi:MAG: RHS repeat-associated core domain-containing protein, partial [Myxococcota bacterium]
LAPLPVSSVVPGFTGHEQDEELGFVNMGGRLFDPETVSFLSQDPFVAAPLHGPSWHGYSYVQHSPTQFVDPSGFLDEPIGPEVKIVADDVESNVMECNDEGCVQNIRFGHSSSASASGEMPTSVGEPAQPGYGQSSGADSRPPSPEEIWETVKGIATGVGEFLAGLVPGVGEAQDVAVIVDPDSAWWEVGLAAGSLGVSVITLGTSPNFGGAIRGGRTIAETVGGVGRAADDVAGSVAGAADNVAEGVSELGGAARAADEGPILFGQQAVSRTFTPPDGPRPSDFEFAGQPIADVAAGIRRGEISPDQIPVQFVRIEGQGRVAVNNRSLTTLRRAGVEPTRAIEVTSPLVERRVRSRLREMGGHARDTIRIRGGPNSRTSAIF